MKIFTASITFQPIDNVRALTAAVSRWYRTTIDRPTDDKPVKPDSPVLGATVGDRLIVVASSVDDPDRVLEMVAFIGNTFNRSMNVRFGELNTLD